MARRRVQPAVSCCTEDRPAVPSPPRGPRAVRIPGKGGRLAQAAAALSSGHPERPTVCSGAFVPAEQRHRWPGLGRAGPTSTPSHSHDQGLVQERPSGLRTESQFGLWRPHTPAPGAEQTEKADAPREPPPVEPKPDPTSGMAAAEAEAALSESSEQGTCSQRGPVCPPLGHPSMAPLLLPPADPTLSHSSTSALGLTPFLILEFGRQLRGRRGASTSAQSTGGGLAATHPPVLGGRRCPSCHAARLPASPVAPLHPLS